MPFSECSESIEFNSDCSESIDFNSECSECSGSIDFNRLQ
jgi:hypothetical protein